MRRTNEERTAATRAGLIAAGRAAFLARGFAGAGAPEIVAAAGVTRGALHHHFGDKRGLFHAVVEAEAAQVAQAIDVSGPADGSAFGELLAGGRAFLDAMAAPGRVALMLLEAPAVLDQVERDAIDARNGLRTLEAGLGAAFDEAGADPAPVGALAELLSAAYDRAALMIAQGAERARLEAALERLLAGAVGAAR
jgi:AcrR family transcriptional regulator